MSQAYFEPLSAAIARIAPSLVQVHGQRSAITATGVAWRAGLVVTTHSGTWDDAGIELTLPSGERRPATVLGRDPGTDLLILKVEGEALPLPHFRGLEGLLPGTTTIAVGRRSGGVRASWGPLTEVSGPWTTALGARVDGRLDVDASLPRGLTGGPLVDIEGQVLGINTRRLDRGGTTIPVATVDRIVDVALQGGNLRPGWLGVGVLPVDLPRALQEELGQARGLILLKVDEGGPAAQAGWLLGDVILRLGEEAVSRPGTLRSALGPLTVGKPLAARLLRAGQQVEVPVIPGPRPD